MPQHKPVEEKVNSSHGVPEEIVPGFEPMAAQIYEMNDSVLQHIEPVAPHYRAIKTLDELLERDEQREKDGFKRKINVGRVIKPSGSGNNKIVVVPTTVEEKFYHDNRTSDERDQEDGDGDGDIGQTTGTAEGDEGDVIGEIPLNPEGEGEGSGPGQGDGESHEMGSSAYDLGKILTEKFRLPNLKDKGKKKSLTKYVYNLVDRNRGAGQILDKKRTLFQILKTNIGLEKITYSEEFNPEDLLINPHDYVYRTMSREKDHESQAIVFFVRDYSGSMSGRPTEVVCSQHVMIFSWLMYQYKEQVQTRFVLHDTEAKEVPDFYTYHNMRVAGGTQIYSAIEKVNRIIEEENLARDYNIYLFYGGDGDDWNQDEKRFEAAMKKLYSVANRVGMTVVRAGYRKTETTFETFLKKFGLTGEAFREKARLDVVSEDADYKRLIEGIKELVS